MPLLAEPPASRRPDVRALAHRGLTAAAEELGFRVFKDRTMDFVVGVLAAGDTSASIRIEPLSLEVTTIAPDPNPFAPPEADTRIVVESPAIERRLFVASQNRRRLAERQRLGDAAFDAAFHCTGGGPDYLAALGAKARACLLAMDGPIQISGGRITCNVSGLFAEPERIASRVQDLMTLVQAMAVRPTALVLSERAVQDPAPLVRQAALRYLTRDHPEEHVTLSTCRAALDDPDPAVRVAAAQYLGPAGFDAAVEVALDRTIRTSTRKAAVDFLAPRLPFEAAHEVFGELLTGRRFQSEAARALGRYRDPRAVPALLSALPLPAAIEALGRFDVPEVESSLIGLLDHGERDVRHAAAASLRRVGRHRAAAALWDVLRDPMLHPTTQTRFRSALAAIRRRRSGSQGSLAFASFGLEGTVSLSPASGGGTLALSPYEEA